MSKIIYRQLPGEREDYKCVTILLPKSKGMFTATQDYNTKYNFGHIKAVLISYTKLDILDVYTTGGSGYHGKFNKKEANRIYNSMVRD